MGCKTCGQKNWGLAHKQYQKVFDRQAIINVFQCKSCGHFSVNVVEAPPYVRKGGDRMPRYEKKEEKLTQEEIEIRKKQKPTTVIVKRGGKREEVQV
jgi:NMD protein affecting ribosome stability and mRNA decay